MLSKRFLISLSLTALVIATDFWPYPGLTPLRQITKIFDLFYFPGILPSSSLPHYQLSFSITDMSQSNIAGSLTMDDQDYSVKIRQSETIWKIKFTDSGPHGYQQFHFYPLQSEHFFALLTFYRAQRLGLIAPDRWLATVSINQQLPRVYLIIEAWTKDVLEKNRRNSDSDLFGPIDSFSSWFWPSKLTSNPQSPIDYSSLRALESSPENLIDLDSFTRWYTLSQLPPRPNSLGYLLYFNRESGLFEFVPDPFQPTSSWLIDQLLRRPQIQLASQSFFHDYLQNRDNLNDDANFLRQLYHQNRFAIAKDFLKPYSNLFLTLRVSEYLNQLSAFKP